MARPMPLDAPVTRATLSRSFIWFPQSCWASGADPSADDVGILGQEAMARAAILGRRSTPTTRHTKGDGVTGVKNLESSARTQHYCLCLYFSGEILARSVTFCDIGRSSDELRL